MKKSLQFFLEITKEYYSILKDNPSDNPIVWTTSFAPIEILDAFNIDCFYPESYSAVISASGKESVFIEKSLGMGFDDSVCSYSTCFNGSFFSGKGPKGVPPKPDILVATNNQCNTLPGWWNYLSLKLGVPLFVVDYPGENNFNKSTRNYIISQHKELIKFLKTYTGRKFNEDKLKESIKNSVSSIENWSKTLNLRKDNYISPRTAFDYLLPMVVRRSDSKTGLFYKHMYEELLSSTKRHGDYKKILWLGYPLWHEKWRYFKEIEDETMRIIIDDYSGWWNLCYAGDDWQEQLVNAYNFTHLNRGFEHKYKLIEDIVDKYKIDGIVLNSNKSCKRFSALLQTLKESFNTIPSVILESDMVDRSRELCSVRQCSFWGKRKNKD